MGFLQQRGLLGGLQLVRESRSGGVVNEERPPVVVPELLEYEARPGGMWILYIQAKAQNIEISETAFSLD